MENSEERRKDDDLKKRNERREGRERLKTERSFAFLTPAAEPSEKVKAIERARRKDVNC